MGKMRMKLKGTSMQIELKKGDKGACEVNICLSREKKKYFFPRERRELCVVFRQIYGPQL
jgi:hypothetical protein